MTLTLDIETEDSLHQALLRMGLISDGEHASFTPLTGGVSSLIVKVDTPRGALCLKRALPKLKVSRDWFAPVERNEAEIAWLRVAEACVLGAVPQILGEDPDTHTFAMNYLDSDAYAVWKAQLLSGCIEQNTARAVAVTMAKIHAATAGRDDMRQRFANDAQFAALRLEPYLEATARAHPDLAVQLEGLRVRTASTKHVLVHGDVSPKNILVGAGGIVLLDAECAWYGDPAFDLAFCLNHMILKSALDPRWMNALGGCWRAIVDSYFPFVAWEDRAGLDARTAALLPGLLLARIDGKSPVEYLADETVRNRVRHVARAALAAPPPSLAALWRSWEEGR